MSNARCAVRLFRLMRAAGRAAHGAARTGVAAGAVAAGAVAAGAVLAGAVIAPARPAAAADFYRGRTVSIIAGHSAGGGYDLYARVLARHLGRHIPGNPVVVPSNMPGAGGLRLANYLYTAAPKDGTALGIFSRGMAIAPLLGAAQFDGRRFTWVGSATSDVSVCIASTSAAVKSWDDVAARPFVAGGEGAGSDPNIFALLYKNLLGAKIKLVSGYPGTSDITLAMERGEVDGMCGISWSTIKSRHADWIAASKINVLVQAGLRAEPDIAAVPAAADLVKDAEQRQILQLALVTQAMARPFAAPPGIPPDRKDILRRAFDETMSDPEFRAETQRLQLDIDPVPGPAIDAMLKEIYATPKDVAARAAKAMSE